MHSRAYFLDLIRGFTIILMALFHFGYDLNMLRLYEFNMNNTFWYYFPRVIVFLFLFCVGVSLKISHEKGINWQKVGERFVKIAFFALIISITTYFAFPKNWIYFGTLHCIALSSVLGVFFINQRILSWILIIIIPTSYLYFDLSLIKLSIIPDVVSMDFIPIYPWFWVVLLGQRLSTIVLNIKIPQTRTLDFLSLLGKNSLKIYLLHQPIIFGSLWLIAKLLA